MNIFQHTSPQVYRDRREPAFPSQQGRISMKPLTTTSWLPPLHCQDLTGSSSITGNRVIFFATLFPFPSCLAEDAEDAKSIREYAKGIFYHSSCPGQSVVEDPFFNFQSAMRIWLQYGFSKGECFISYHKVADRLFVSWCSLWLRNVRCLVLHSFI